MTIFTLRGIPVRLHVSFVIMAVSLVLWRFFTYNLESALLMAFLGLLLFGTVLLHELGHGLGLEHYYVDTNCIEDECDYSPIMFSSISVFEEQVKNVTDKDISMIERMYGEDGFGGMTPKWIPRICDIQCLEVDCGKSRMC